VAELGDVYTAAGKDDLAAQQYALVEAIGELYRANGISTDLQLAVFFADHDLRTTEALQAARTVYAEQPDSIYAADARAWTLYKAGRPEEALPFAREALRLSTADASLWYHTGMIYAALGDDASARTHLERAFEINPHFSTLQAPIALATLEELAE
jgi:Flp pilus assembly protein TadD